MAKNESIVKPSEVDPLAAMGVDDVQLRRASNTQKLTTAWFCTLNSVMSSCCH